MVQAIATLLNPDSSQKTRAFWSLLESKCHLIGIKTTPLPHFSWQGAERYDPTLVKQELDLIASQKKTFMIQTSGLGLFTGANPVLYLALVKNREMLEFHELIWNSISPKASKINSHYSPQHWMPHITLAYRDIDVGKLSCAVSDFLFEPLDLQIEVNNLALIFESQDELGLGYSVPLIGSK